MNIKNQLICLLIVAVLSLCVFNNVVAAPVSKPTTVAHGTYGMYSREQAQYHITIVSYPQQVKVKEMIYVKGKFTKDDVGVPNAKISHFWKNDTDNKSYFLWNVKTSEDGTFIDKWQLKYPYTDNVAYVYFEDNEPLCMSDVLYITAS